MAKEDYIQKGDDLFIADSAIASAHGWLTIDKSDSLSFKTPGERILQFPLEKGNHIKKDGRVFFKADDLASATDAPYYKDKDRNFVVISTFDNPGLAYSDISKKESVKEVPLRWDWPEDGIKNVEVKKADGRVDFIFTPTGETLASIIKNPKDFPQKDDTILDMDEGNFLVARVAVPDTRATGEAPSDRSKAIEGIWSVLTSTAFDKKAK
ncbi:hypothetical protein HMPREF1863_00938 [Aedoeadaptatus coxii]|uniref:Uncharacterized protein n=3 Tax=Aedoeadaptatus coxii TaxID=755172 RepID=A0A134AGN4_9FIRM|nr:hypothetical protein HMPREF1863_00938 [Peptoniphilus coxii]